MLKSLFDIKLQPWNPATLFKRDSNTSVFLWILRNCYEQFFFREHLYSCSCKWLLWKITVVKSSFSEKEIFQKIAGLIDNWKGLLWKGAVTHNNCFGTNNKNTWEMPLIYSYSVEWHRSSHRRCFKDTVMQIEKALMNDLLRASKVSWKSHIPTIYNLPVKFAVFLKSSLRFIVPIIFYVYKENFTAQ